MKTSRKGLIALCVVAAACAPKAETPASPHLAKICDDVCGKRASCEKGFNAEACNKRCTTYESVRRVEGLRADVGDRILECMSKNACADDSMGSKPCTREVAATLTPSEKAKSLCAKLEPQFRDCNVTWDVPCVQELSFFETADLGVFDECVDRQCRGGRACFTEAEHKLLVKHAR